MRDLAGLDESAEIVFSDFGWASRVYMVNKGEIVFKFPRDERVKDEYKLETRAYKLAKEIKSDILIPEGGNRSWNRNIFGKIP